jgi:rRNA maturation protein Nop10
MIRKKEKCPSCGERTLEPIWMGMNPQICPECGHQEDKRLKIEY